MGLFKKIGKVFKKVAKVAIKVAPIALAAGAVIFSGGAALGLAPLGIAGGWGAAASSLIGATGATGGLASVLTSGLTNAGFGAAIGGLTSLVTGGNVAKGAALGAAAGGVTGVVSGGFNAVAPPAVASRPAVADPLRGRVTEAISASGAAVNGPATPGNIVTTPLPPPAASAPVAPAASPGGFSAFLGDNKEIVGRTLAGAATGLIQGMGASDEYKYARERDEERRARFDLPEGGYEPGGEMADTRGYVRPVRKYNRRGLPDFVAKTYRFDPEEGRIVVS